MVEKQNNTEVQKVVTTSNSNKNHGDHIPKAKKFHPQTLISLQTFPILSKQPRSKMMVNKIYINTIKQNNLKSILSDG
jgi:hypothetical protein